MYTNVAINEQIVEECMQMEMSFITFNNEQAT